MKSCNLSHVMHRLPQDASYEEDASATRCVGSPQLQDLSPAR